MLFVRWRAGFGALLLLSGCTNDGVGDPCIPEIEYEPAFGGFSKDEVNVESRSFQCETRLCLVNNFQGRVSCPYGQSELGHCELPDGAGDVEVLVLPQLVERQANDAVYCSCRCNGPDSDGPYCDCPSGFTCAELLPNIDLGQRQLPGGYCVKNDTDIEPEQLSDETCDAQTSSCGPR